MATPTALFVTVAILPPVSLLGLGFGFTQFYREGVKGYKQNIENDLKTAIDDENVSLPHGDVEVCGEMFYRAHLYYDLYKKCFWLVVVGSISWTGAYVPRLAGGEWETLVMGSSPLGMPVFRGLETLGALSWLLAIVFALIIVLVFGHDPVSNATVSLVEEPPGEETA